MTLRALEFTHPMKQTMFSFSICMYIFKILNYTDITNINVLS